MSKHQLYKCSDVYFSWGLFYIMPQVLPLIETENHKKGFAIDWLGFEICFEVID